MFKDRRDAGIQLLKQLSSYEKNKNCIVFGIPRGGVVVAAEVAMGLNLPLDLIITKKIGAPFNPELAIGSVDPEGKAIVDENAQKRFNISSEYLETAVATITANIKKQLQIYRGSYIYPSLKQHEAIVVDDGIATGQTMIAAIDFLRRLKTKRIIVATPVIAPSTLTKLNEIADEVRYVLCEKHFFAVGQFYQDFKPVNDKEVISIMKQIGKKKL